MIVVLPPSETKTEGGTGVLALDALVFPSLTGRRRRAMAAARRIPLRDAATVLKLGPRSAHEAGWNRALSTSPVRPAIERYAGVLYEGLDAASLDGGATGWLERHVLLASAMFGLLRPSDPIPAYRLSASTPLPALPLKGLWSGALPAALASTGEWVLDARSSAYAALGPAPAGSAILHVESEDPDGRRRALNHFNKHGKGELVRGLARSGAEVASRDELLAWGADAGVRLEPRGEQDVVLVLPA
ncbi:peroxide stress protein YaaA [Amnibacterium sp. CER49]|uniref:YaaA family protein n=1 Tax=Amnibacterium sp. CER49 TaxID=3039161 RepID=UPI00244AC27D|nr:peroxide stress protein YaaA [Amnibacterium sp. CER49]MDH2445088.1 peroxide stress protein YaaA [Amnibacterium sp. CER49]